MEEDSSAKSLASTCSPEIKRQVLNRLRRANGQLASIIKAVEGDADCRAVITQLAAVSAAVRRAGYVIVANHMEHSFGTCGETDADAGQQPNDISVAELEKLFMMLG